MDDGCVQGTSIATTDKYIACGSNCGIVNVYDSVGATNSSSNCPQPAKALKNLVTSIDHLELNHSQELLAMGSIEKDNAIRLVSRT